MSKEPTDYRPIPCTLHSEYELAILRGRRLRLRWRDAGGGDHIEAVRPVDLLTGNGEEFMVVEDAAGAHRQLRLDRIIEHHNEEREHNN